VTARANVAALLLVGVGLLSMTGTALGLEPLRRLGLLTVASPLPLVFSKFRGVENFSSDYFMDLVFVDGDVASLPITAAAYARTTGPYNRRNPYGAVLAYGPMLDKPAEVALRDAVMRYAACGRGTFLRELGVTKEVRRVDVTLRSKTRAKPQWRFAVTCPTTTGAP
jgi:hypothetical protein